MLHMEKKRGKKHVVQEGIHVGHLLKEIQMVEVEQPDLSDTHYHHYPEGEVLEHNYMYLQK